MEFANGSKESMWLLGHNGSRVRVSGQPAQRLEAVQLGSGEQAPDGGGGSEIRGMPPHERRLVWQARAKRLLDNLEHWLRAAPDKLSRKSDTSAAIMCALNLWPALVRYCNDGAIEIDNLAAQRAMRGVAIGPSQLSVRRRRQRRRTRRCGIG